MAAVKQHTPDKLKNGNDLRTVLLVVFSSPSSIELVAAMLGLFNFAAVIKTKELKTKGSGTRTLKRCCVLFIVLASPRRIRRA